MENQEDIKLKFSKHLFWDIDITTLDMQAHKAYILERVIDYGQMHDWLLVKEYYGLNEIKNIALGIKCMSPQALAFLSIITHTPENQFRCYELLQSKNRPWYF